MIFLLIAGFCPFLGPAFAWSIVVDDEIDLLQSNKVDVAVDVAIAAGLPKGSSRECPAPVNRGSPSVLLYVQRKEPRVPECSDLSTATAVLLG
eukprot:scaffold46579_cov66-Attheya_sp.AAC.4